MKNRLIFFLLLSATWMQAQQIVPFNGRIEWESNPKIHNYSDGTTVERWRFKNSAFSDETPTLPVFYDHIALSGRASITVEITAANFEPFAKKPSADDAFLSNELQIEAFVEQEGLKFWGGFRFIPIRKSGAGFERLTDFSLNIRITPINNPAATDRGGPQTYNSALSDGAVYKFGVNNTGFYKLELYVFKKPIGYQRSR